MTKRYTDPAKPARQLAVECVHCDENGRPVLRRVIPLVALMRGLTVTLPVQTTFTVDRPGAI